MEPQNENNTPKYIFNPLKEDYTAYWDGKPYVLHSIEVGEFPSWLADHIAQGLARKIAVDKNAGGIGQGSNFEDEYNKALREIEVNVEE